MALKFHILSSSMLLVFAIGSSSCGEQTDKSEHSDDVEVNIDQELKNINPYAAYFDMQIDMNTEINCLIAENYSGISRDIRQKSDKDISELFIKRMTDRYTGLCEAYKQARTETRGTFEEIKSKGRLLERQFIFSVFLLDKDSDGDAYFEEKIGFFSTLTSCKKIENIARKYIIPTKACREWVDMNSMSTQE